DEGQVTAILARLIELGAIEWARESVSLPRATGRPPRTTPANAVVVPMGLRSPPAPRPIAPIATGSLRIPRPSQPEMKPPEYVGHDVAEDASAPSRVVVSPRASHTGAREPAGEVVEDLATADTMPPPPGAGPGSGPPIPRHSSLPAAPLPSSPAGGDAGGGASVEPTASLLAELEEIPELEPPEEPASAQPEVVDLDPERRRRIDELYIALDLLDHYEVLGLGREVSRADIRTAYFTLSKVFHPDTMFRKRLGAYKAKMESIFKRLTESYEVLGKTKARKEYDHYLKLQDRTRAVEVALDGDGAAERRKRAADLLAAEAAPVARAAEPAPAESPAEPMPPREQELVEAPAEAAAPAADPRRAMSAAGRQVARELFAKRLAAAKPPEKRPEPAPEPQAPPPASPVGKDRALRDLATSLRGAAGITGGLDPVTRHIRNAERAEAAGDLVECSRLLRLALALAPERADIVAEHARVSAKLASSLADAYEEKARYEESQAKWAAAAVSWAKVFEGRPTDARAARLAAEALLAAKGDLHRAKEFAVQASELEPESVAALATLAKVYI
ncbi:hypothetical protein ARNL5_01298, partial [Anaerolineae bacterium]